MRTFVLSAFVALLAGGIKLDTTYSTDKGLEVAIVFKQSSETTMSMERDGEPVEGMGGGGMSAETQVSETYVDRFLEVADGKPRKVRRHWTDVSGTTSMSMGDNATERELESPFKGLVVEIDAEGEATVVEGTEPEGEEALKGHKLLLCLDALLPAKEVAVDDTWDLEKDAIVEALHQEVLSKLTPPPARPEGGEGRGQRGGGGGRGGMRGGRSGRGGNLRDIDWTGQAKVLSVDEEVDGVACTVVELKLEASGSRELPAMGRPRDGAFGLPLENTQTYSYELEGKLHWDNKEQRPLKLELKGEGSVESVREMSREESTMRMESTEEMQLEYSVVVSEAKAETKSEAKKD